MSNWRFKIKGDSNGKNGEAARFNQITAEGISECRRTQTQDLESLTTLIQDMSQDTHTETLHSDTYGTKEKARHETACRKEEQDTSEGATAGLTTDFQNTNNRMPKHSNITASEFRETGTVELEFQM